MSDMDFLLDIHPQRERNGDLWFNAYHFQTLMDAALQGDEMQDEVKVNSLCKNFEDGMVDALTKIFDEANQSAMASSSPSTYSIKSSVYSVNVYTQHVEGIQEDIIGQLMIRKK